MISSSIDNIEVEEMPLLQSLSDEKDESSIASIIPSSVLLFDKESTLNITRDIADGFLIFLSSGSKSAALMKSNCNEKKTKSPKLATTSSHSDCDIGLAFAAITDGNIIDAVFGVQNCGGLKRHKDTSVIAYNRSKSTKNALRDAADSSEALKQLTVETFCHCFETIVTYHNNIDDLNLLTWCYKHQRVYDKAGDDLDVTFKMLSEAVSASI
uniref:Uncharacterized protein n=1 Tax=Eucampia antarctica TaxID=49252 RepID=A0A7S2R676_9STRA|mmetsp:Transcript_17699/g.17114  ORF Transcript_17699/g.17114 Transcript_17699/m.17114 type:complete len:212 (+) Transcript_17699:84-719(+)|eukprot:CAMPEP_0197835856 /NCGR_PEP_ID=MMETSP1437-20131217/27165_1 /TAXON_ID=49252 ORGANISM="Eucampia antarctica, Strain CCMP1452" /NCGR_SAMPLE_ID=MMETSP1437 /ASSEMBLY_ACC=CAM_ASM_001096 /LENGTH=211 /DNA_ID=CAMNT_0043441575 /DNA_START=83 /DNA_END=718 /DNA_ORIENTATION=+